MCIIAFRFSCADFPFVKDLELVGVNSNMFTSNSLDTIPVFDPWEREYVTRSREELRHGISLTPTTFANVTTYIIFMYNNAGI